MKRSHQRKSYELLGWFGVVAILTSYGLLSFNVIEGRSYTYHLLVLVGAATVALISYHKRAMQPFVLNAIFCILAIVALGSLLLDK